MKTKLKDNVIFRAIIIPILIILCFVGQFIPSVNGLSSDAFGVIFIFIGVLLLWLTIGIDWPSLLCLFALGFIDKFGFNKVLSSSFGNSTFAFLLFTFVCTYALSKTSLIKRIALTFVNFKIAQKKNYTCFGIASALTRITSAIIADEKAIICVSSYDPVQKIFISTPSVIGINGVEKTGIMTLNQEEIHKFETSANIIRNAINEI